MIVCALRLIIFQFFSGYYFKCYGYYNLIKVLHLQNYFKRKRRLS
jgi:hypothetical protein